MLKCGILSSTVFKLIESDMMKICASGCMKIIIFCDVMRIVLSDIVWVKKTKSSFMCQSGKYLCPSEGGSCLYLACDVITVSPEAIVPVPVTVSVVIKER